MLDAGVGATVSVRGAVVSLAGTSECVGVSAGVVGAVAEGVVGDCTGDAVGGDGVLGAVGAAGAMGAGVERGAP